MLKVAIIGKVNTGKSTLFNALVGSNVSMSWNQPATTRDIVEAVGHSKKRSYVFMDTAGFYDIDHPLQKIMEEQTMKSIHLSDIVIAVFDVSGFTELDRKVRDLVRRSGKPYIFVVNKVDSKNHELSLYEVFSSLGDFIHVSALHKKGIDKLLQKLDEIADSIESRGKSEQDILDDREFHEAFSKGLKRAEREMTKIRRKEIETEFRISVGKREEKREYEGREEVGEGKEEVGEELDGKELRGRTEGVDEEKFFLGGENGEFGGEPETQEHKLGYVESGVGSGIDLRDNEIGIDKRVDLFKDRSEAKTRRFERRIRISFVGRPNVGKSSLVNAILGYPRCIVYDEPGTTRDAIRIPFEYDGNMFVLVDTPGIRRKSKIERGTIEYKSLGSSLTAIFVSDVCVLVVDSFDGITHHDKHIASIIERRGKALVVALNKIDLIKEMRPAGGVGKFVEALRTTMRFIGWSYFIPVSAKTKYGIPSLLDAIVSSYDSWTRRLKPSELLRIRQKLLRLDFMKRQEPKIFQLAVKPPTFLIYVNEPESLRKHQITHVGKIIRSLYGFYGSPIHFRVKRHGESF